MRMELTTLLRNYEQLLLVLVIPLGVLVFFGNVDVLPESSDLTRLLASVIALAVMSTAMVSTGISTGFERSYHVLKRLGATPLGRNRLIIAKAGAVAVIEAVQGVLLVTLAVGMGWSTTSVSWMSLLLAVVLGTFAFAGVGLCMAGRLRAEVNLAAQNALYLLLLAVGGVLVPTEELPDGLAAVSQWLPSGSLARVLHDAASGAALDERALLVLVAWAIVAPAAAARLFRFDG
jgi:ABC-2 type transport system permease protein